MVSRFGIAVYMVCIAPGGGAAVGSSLRSYEKPQSEDLATLIIATIT